MRTSMILEGGPGMFHVKFSDGTEKQYYVSRKQFELPVHKSVTVESYTVDKGPNQYWKPKKKKNKNWNKELDKVTKEK